MNGSHRPWTSSPGPATAGNATRALQAAQINRAQRTLITPVAGTVGRIQVSHGNLINAQTVVTTVEDSSEILINFWVPERYSSQISVGGAVNGCRSMLPATLRFMGSMTSRTGPGFGLRP